MVTIAESKRAGRERGYDFSTDITNNVFAAPEEFCDEMSDISVPYGLSGMIEQIAYQVEENSHQYADWTNGLGYEMMQNCSDNFNVGEACFEAYEEGVSQGINQGIADAFKSFWKSIRPTKRFNI